MMQTTLKMTLCLMLAAFTIAAVPARAHTLRLSDGGYASFAELVADLKNVDIIFIGELHDNVGHHRAQLQVIQALKEAGVPVTIGLEMFRQDSQGALDFWVAGRMSEDNFLKVYNQNWSMWPVYRDIFLYAQQMKIPLVGLNLTREVTQQVARGGLDSLTPRQLGELPRVRCDVDATYQEFIRRSLGTHVHNGTQFAHFCEAQMLWDSVMARNLLDYLKANPQAVVVVLAGSGHAWKHGIAEQLRRQGGTADFRVLLPEVPGRLEAGSLTTREADYLLLGVEQGPLH